MLIDNQCLKWDRDCIASANSIADAKPIKHSSHTSTGVVNKIERKFTPPTPPSAK
jgi:hypothetical protein